MTDDMGGSFERHLQITDVVAVGVKGENICQLATIELND